MSFTRRKFLKTCGRGMSAATMLSALSYAGLENAYAQAGDFKALVCLFLEGGNDGWNTVVPLETSEYNTYATGRGPMALAQGSLLRVTAPSHGGRPYGFHPSLSGLHTLWGQGRVALACNVGNLIAPVTVEQVRSNPAVRPGALFDHFAQQVWSQNLRLDDTQGWGNRLGSHIRTLNGAPLIPATISVVNNTPFLKGPEPTITLQPGLQLGISGLPSTGTPPIRFTALQQLAALRDTPSLQVNAFNSRLSRAIDDSRLVGNVFASDTLTTVFPNTGLGQQLRQIARALAARDVLGLNRRQIFYAQVGGNAYDTHGDQLATQQRLLTELSQAMSAFYAATVELGVQNQVTTFTFSEFGRTVRNNGAGTDHGWGNNYLVMGGAVRGGDFYGTYPPLVIGGPLDYELFGVSGNARGAMLPTTSIDQYGATLARWFGLSDAAINDVFLNIGRFPTRTMGFLP